MKKLTININRCPQNHPCPSLRVCPVSALTQKCYKAPDINYDKCLACGKCVKYCPMGAFRISD